MPPLRIVQLGLGRMGLPIAHALRDTGFDVAAVDPAVPGVAVSALDLVGSAQVLLTVLPGPPEVEAALAELAPLLPPDALWLDLTSSDPRVTESVAAGAAFDVVGAVMGGGVGAAHARTLHFFVGGAAASVGRASAVLEVLGTVEHVGEGVGDGQLAKLLANLLWFGQAVAVTEALLLGRARGLDPVRLGRTLAASAGGSAFLDEYLDALLDGDDLTDFGLDRVVEELDTLAALAGSAAVPFELGQTVTRLHREALERFGAIDGELLAARLLEERGGGPLGC